MRNTYLVCYDISNDLRLRRVHKTMCGFGDRLQYSVFECRFSATDLAHCRHALGKLIHHREDQVLFVHLGPADGRGERVITSLGRAYSSLDAPCITTCCTTVRPTPSVCAAHDAAHRGAARASASQGAARAVSSQW